MGCDWVASSKQEHISREGEGREDREYVVSETYPAASSLLYQQDAEDNHKVRSKETHGSIKIGKTHTTS